MRWTEDGGGAEKGQKYGQGMRGAGFGLQFHSLY